MISLAFLGLIAAARSAGMRPTYADSNLDWTIARITNQTDKPSKGMLRVGYLGGDKIGSAMLRIDIAPSSPRN